MTESITGRWEIDWYVAPVATSRTLPIDLLQAAVSLALRQGWDVNALLAEAGVSPLLLAEGRSRVTDEQLVRIVQALWRQTDDELFGLGHHPLPRGSFRLLCYGLAGAADLREAMRRVQAFVKAMPAIPLEISVEGDETRLTLLGRRDEAAQVMDVVGLAACHRLIMWLIRRPLPLTSLELAVEDDRHRESLALVFDMSPTFAAPRSSLAFDSSVLASPLMRDEEDIDLLVARSPRDLLVRTAPPSTLAEQVRRMLEVALQRGEWLTAPSVAERLSMGEQTVRRGLAKEGTSLRQLNEEIRRDAAVTSLVGGNESVTELSDRLGFSEPSAFVRAFRRWTGSTPATYRRQGGVEV